jgi:hypothetical protein
MLTEAVADADYSGKAFMGVAGETIAFGKTVYLNLNDTRWYLTLANSEATSGKFVTMCVDVNGSTAGNPITLLKSGFVRKDALLSPTKGVVQYLSDTSAGDIQESKPSDPGHVQRRVGYGSMTAHTIYFEADMDVVIV